MFTPFRTVCAALCTLMPGILSRLRGIFSCGVRDCPEIRLEADDGQSGRVSSLQQGAAAPGFTLPRVGGGGTSLSDYSGRCVLLVFIRTSCQRSHEIARELNRVQRFGETQLLAISLDSPHETALWADEVLATFPVLVDSDHEIVVAYDVPDAPFASVIDAEGRIAGSGFIAKRGTLTSHSDPLGLTRSNQFRLFRLPKFDRISMCVNWCRTDVSAGQHVR
jgi:peroxiredoxin